MALVRTGYANFAAFPGTGAANIIYVDLSNGNEWIWTTLYITYVKTNVATELGYKDSAWFTTNASLLLGKGQIVFLQQTGTYKLGDGITALSALLFLGGSSTTPNLQEVTNEGSSTTNELQFKDGSNNVVALIGPNQLDVLNDVGNNSLFNIDRVTNTISNLGIPLATVNDIPSLAGLAPINSPTFTGTPLAPAPAQYDATTQIPTTKWVRDNAGGCLYRNITGGTSITGVTTQQLVDGCLLAANTIEAGYDLYNELNVNKNLDNGTVTVRVLYNSTNSLSGATTLATFTSTTANNQVSFVRNFGVISATVTELLFAPTTSSTGDFIATSNTTVTQLNIDWTQPIYILWSLQNSSALDTSVMPRNKLWKK